MTANPDDLLHQWLHVPHRLVGSRRHVRLGYVGNVLPARGSERYLEVRARRRGGIFSLFADIPTRLYVPPAAVDEVTRKDGTSIHVLRAHRRECHRLYSEVPSIVEQDPANKTLYLQNRLDILHQRRSNRSNGRQFYLLASAAFLFTAALYVTSSHLAQARPYVIAAYLAGVALVFLLLCLLSTPRDIERQIGTLENEIELRKGQVSEQESRAERLFRLHQLELDKYYQQTLEHSSWIFLVGMVCLLAGFAVIGLSLYLLVDAVNGRQAWDKAIVGVLGSISGILSSYIASIYLRMYAQTAQSLTVFHNRLTLANRAHYGNFLAAKIEDKDRREQVLADMAMTLASQFGEPAEQGTTGNTAATSVNGATEEKAAGTPGQKSG